MNEMHDPADIRRRIDRMAARIDRRDDYGLLLARGDVIRRRAEVPEPDEWRAAIRARARGDRIKVRTGVNDHIVYALMVDADTPARRAESDRHGEVLRRMVPPAHRLGHEPVFLARDGDGALLRCDRCPAFGYADAAEGVLGGALVVDACPHGEPPRRTSLAFM